LAQAICDRNKVLQLRYFALQLRGCHRRNFGALHVPFLPFGTFLVKG